MARRLHSEGQSIRVFARPGPRGEALRAEGIEFLPGDIRNPSDVNRAVSGCAVVYHLAAQYRLEGVPLQEFRDTNTGGTRHILDACRNRSVDRLVHVSTVGVYGDLVELPAAEGHRTAPNDHYQKTKHEAESAVAAAMRGDLAGRVVILRPTGVYGPGDRRFLKIFRGIGSGYFVFPGRGALPYHPTYLDDALDGLILAATHPNAPGNIYNIAGASYLPLVDYVRTIARVLAVAEPKIHVPLWPLKVAAHLLEKTCRPLGIEPPLFPRRLAFFHSARAFSIEKARREIGFAPKIDLEEGLRRTAAWYRDQGLLPASPRA